MDIDILRKAGLTESQAKGYLVLIENRELTPVELAAKISENRTNGYAIMDKLVSLGLAAKNESKKASYSAKSPIGLKKLLISQQKKLKSVDNELSGLMPELLSTYRLTSDQPGVLYLEGADSLQRIYDDLIHTGEPLYIIPSAHDRDNPEIAAMIDRQIQKQRVANIPSYAILQKKGSYDFKPDELLKIRTAPISDIGAQIMIFGPNVATTTFNKGVVSMVITSPLVAASFLQVFQALWSLGSSIDKENDSQSG